MFKLKGCPRCRGDLFLEYRDEWRCLQCGRHYYQFTPEPHVYRQVAYRYKARAPGVLQPSAGPSNLDLAAAR